MGPLTERVIELAAKTPHEAILTALKNDLPKDSHVEHLLSYLADQIAIGESFNSKLRDELLEGEQFSTLGKRTPWGRVNVS